MEEPVPFMSLLSLLLLLSGECAPHHPGARCASLKGSRRDEPHGLNVIESVVDGLI